MEQLAILIFIGLILLLNAVIKRIARGLAQQQAARGGRQPAPEALPEPVRELLEEIGAARPRQPQAPAPGQARPAPAWPVPAVMPAEVVEAQPVQERPARPARKALRAAAARRPSKPRRKAPRRRPAAKVTPATPPAPARAPTRAGPRPPFDLKQAVIWAEILGPPVCMRQRIGHAPPTRRRWVTP